MIEIFKNPDFKFIAHRGTALKFSLVLLAIGLGALVMRGGPKWGIDFTGGAAIHFDFEQEVSAEQVRQALNNAGFNSYEVTHFGDPSQILIRLQLGETDENYLAPIQNEFNAIFPDNPYTIEQNDLVGPKIGTELREKALLALLFAMIGIIIYISIRFEAESFLGVLLTLIFGLLVLTVSTTEVVLSSDLWTLLLIMVSLSVVAWICLKFNFKYAVGAIVAVIHDVFITVGLFSVLDLEIDLAIVAALLTIVGYSLNDTIVLFDRIREEYPSQRKRLTLPELVNTCINHVLSRTVITSLTTLLVVLILLMFGGEVIRPFAVALFIGIIAGTYSTVFIASPMMMFWHNRFGEGEELSRRMTT